LEDAFDKLYELGSDFLCYGYNIVCVSEKLDSFGRVGGAKEGFVEPIEVSICK
jgi:hypothetical protein